ncbi:hypothetical protein J1N35_040314 [Gossypium stocksii]|uniref:Uncharacterized protein n=1 Tax=Gossypium stocksii TaxID=47602 RepID=A0A9D3UDD0_9ROSI|nr:hypothetical protein J1N35_040314 [Gossypium stocksii]
MGMPLWVANWPCKWPIFVHTDRDTGVCLSCMRHTVKVHGFVSPGVAIRIKSRCSTRPHARAYD